MGHPTVKIAGSVAAAAAAVGLVGVVAYDHGRSDGKAAGKSYEVYVDRSSLGVFGPEGAAALRQDDAGRRDRFDFYVGKRKVLRLVGSYDEAAGRLTITPK
jgi:hypothetical protein